MYLFGIDGLIRHRKRKFGTANPNQVRGERCKLQIGCNSSEQKDTALKIFIYDLRGHIQRQRPSLCTKLGIGSRLGVLQCCSKSRFEAILTIKWTRFSETVSGDRPYEITYPPE